MWLRVWRALPTYQTTPAGFGGWLFTIARNRLADHHHRPARREHPCGLDLTPTTDSTSSSNGLAPALRAAITHLPPAQQAVVVARFVDGLTTAETAARTGRTPGAVRVLQHRALQRLRTLSDTNGLRQGG